MEAENLLSKMHILHEMGEKHVKPNVVTYGAVVSVLIVAVFYMELKMCLDMA